MPRQPSQQGVHQALFTSFVHSEAASVIAAEAIRRGFGELRVDAMTPHIVLLAKQGDAHALADFGAFASATAGVGIHVKPLNSYPTWRRRATWEGAICVEPSAASDA